MRHRSGSTRTATAGSSSRHAAATDACLAGITTLRANARATLQIGRERIEVKAREAAGEEHERLWEMVTDAYPGYAYYRERSGRHIPVLVLTRDGRAGTTEPAADATGPEAGPV